MSKVDIRAKIAGAQDIKKEMVTVEEWDNVEIEVRTLTGKERAVMMNSAIDTNTGTVDFVKMYPELIIAGSYDPESGDKLFSEGDRDFLNAKSGAAIEKLAAVILRLSGMDKGAIAKAEKNSIVDPKSDSTSN